VLGKQPTCFTVSTGKWSQKYMKISTFKVASLALCTLLCSAGSPVLAGWGSVGGSHGSSGGGSYGSVAYYGGSSGGSSGHRPFTPVRSVLRGAYNIVSAPFARHHARRAAYASYGSSGYSTSYGSSGYGSSGYSTSYGSSGYSTSYGSSGYSTSYGSSGYSTSYGSTGSYETSYGSTGSYGVSYGSTGSHGASYGSTGTPVYYGASNVVSDPVVSVAASSTIDDAVYLTVNVPSAAKVYVNDKLTTSQGSVRQFVSRGLALGKSYKFEVRAELETADGQVVKEEKSLVVSAGVEEQLQFAFSDTKAKIQTSLVLNVPEGAKVTLAGNPTKASGSQRVFHSTQLQLGESWDDYSVEVEFDGNVKRQSIRLIGGDQLALTFDFEQQQDQLAAK
jgi:uncharacterized protein (TIGR03000 family)